MLDFATACAIALKTSLLLIALWGASLGLTRRSAAFRHALLTGALLLSLCMPIAVLRLPIVAVIPVDWLHPGGLTADGALRSTPVGTSIALWSIAWKVWLGGTGVILLYSLAGQWRLSRRRRQASPLRSQEWAETLRQVVSERRFDRPFQVLESSETTNPCTWGCLRPILLLPSDGHTWSERARRHALIHELAHIQRRDYLSANLIRLACAVHWYNPLVWLAAREARRLQEQACDDLVLQSGAMPSDYAQFLVNAIAREHRRGAWPAAALGIVRRSELRERIVAILDPARARRPLSRASLMGTTAPVVCLALALAAAVPEAPPMPPALAAPPAAAAPSAPTVPAVPAVPAVAPVEATPAAPPDLPALRDSANRRRPMSSMNL